MALGTMTSRVLGQLRESLLAAYFDKRVTDAWIAAFRIPNMFRRLLGEGSLSVSFIPIFIESRHNSTEKAQNLVNTVYTFLLLVLGCITTLGILYPEVILSQALDASFIADTEKYLLTLRLTKMMFGFVFLVSSYAFVMGILNSLGQYALPAIAPTLFNICMIVSTILPHHLFSVLGDQLAWGVLLGGVMQAALLVPALVKSGYFPKLSFDYKNKDFQKVVRNMVPGLIGMGLLQFTTLINGNFASSLVEGTISYINYVDRLVELPLSLISVSLGTALLPALSGFLARDERHKIGHTAQHYLELNLLLTMAAAAGLYSLAEPIVQLLFGRGKFLPHDVLMCAQILKTYCWIMVFASGVRVLTPAYFSVKNTWFPAMISAVCLTVHILVAPLLMEYWQVRGLMSSTILSAALNLVLLLIFFPRFVSRFNYAGFFKNIFIFILLAVVTGGVAQIFYLIQPLFSFGFFGLLFNLALSAGLAIFMFVLCGRLLGVTLVTEALMKVKRRFVK